MITRAFGNTNTACNEFVLVQYYVVGGSSQHNDGLIKLVTVT